MKIKVDKVSEDTARIYRALKDFFDKGGSVPSELRVLESNFFTLKERIGDIVPEAYAFAKKDRKMIRALGMSVLQRTPEEEIEDFFINIQTDAVVMPDKEEYENVSTSLMIRFICPSNFCVSDEEILNFVSRMKEPIQMYAVKAAKKKTPQYIRKLQANGPHPVTFCVKRMSYLPNAREVCVQVEYIY